MAPAHPAPPRASPRARDAFSTLVVELFRLNGALLEAGDRLAGDLGLTSARWQVLGAIALAPSPLPVAHLARQMGLARQSVQRLVREMQREGLLRLEPNPHHRRAALVAMTPRGESAYRRTMARKDLWADGLTQGLPPEAMQQAAALLQELRRRVPDSHGHIAAIAAAEEHPA
ncbi:MarR family winged helix-turn-helix transcriptional regulator [Pseudoroseomonas cervicalis]|uniref:MarR family winged helix-turn-helix transcriptional regulator n=1 Tax=Teichococcus cervicalis TaxID=204525 RepID=UPI00277D19D1|nr:helix-turn-helix domain-containing protein [Pseudoroseomonas cervicalis]MDQ1081941.1 DNA-binding MarR family transcriptional regulator [Pseudoroseomonas cervicalis]